jgi:acetate kinase
MKILVLNCGVRPSNTNFIRWKLASTCSGWSRKDWAEGFFSEIHFAGWKKSVMLEGEILEHQTGIEYILGFCSVKNNGGINSLSEIDAVGHRVVHGGEKFNQSVLLTQEVIASIEEYIELAPLHNPPNLKGIYAIQELMPETPQVAVFDTAFHQTMPDYAYMYSLPYSLYEKYSNRRYGFMERVQRYVSKRLANFLAFLLKSNA